MCEFTQFKIEFFFGLGFFFISGNEAIVYRMLCVKCFDVTRLMLIVIDVRDGTTRVRKTRIQRRAGT